MADLKTSKSPSEVDWPFLAQWKVKVQNEGTLVESRSKEKFDLKAENCPKVFSSLLEIWS